MEYAHTGQMDRLSDLPEGVLLHILSFLPTKVAARTSLISRQFRSLWAASPVIDLNRSGTSSLFVNLANRTILNRNPPSPLIRLFLRFRSFLCLVPDDEAPVENSYIASLLDKASSLGLRHLTVTLHPDMCESILPRILSLCCLESLSLEYMRFHQLALSTPINLKSLKRLCIDLTEPFGYDFIHRVVPQLDALEDLHIELLCGRIDDFLEVRSMTVRKLKLHVFCLTLRIFAPSLELFELTSSDLQCNPGDWEIPMLRKAVIKLSDVNEENVKDVSKMLSAIAHVRELHLKISESQYQKDTFHALLVPAVDPPSFIRLKHFHLEICFHEFNIEDLVIIIQHSSALETLKLVHKPPVGARKDKKKNLWRSKLPQNAERNYRHCHFEDLHIAEKKEELLRKLIKKERSKRLKT